MVRERVPSLDNERRDRPPLSPRFAEALQRALAALRRDTSAQCVFLTDRQGGVIAEAGDVREALLDTVLPILAEEVSIAAQLGQVWDDVPVLSLHHYEGGQYEVYAAAAADLPFLLVTLTWQRSPAYSAVIWLFVRRTVQELRGLLRAEGRISAEARSDGSAEGEAEAISFGGLTQAQARALGLLSEETVKEGVGEE